MAHARSIFACSLFMAAISTPLSAGMTIGLSGSATSNNLGTERSQSNAASANLNLDLTDFLRVGLTHRRSFESGHGYKRLKNSAGGDIYVEFESESRTISNSIDLIVVLYNGPVSPYIFGGVGKKDYYSQMNCAIVCSSAPVTGSLFPVPNYGFGVGIYLSKDFSLKISQTYSPGIATKTNGGIPILDPETGKEKTTYVQDSYTQIGINYNL